ncbi:nicotinamide-nucleotide amidase [Breznakibacter xylanolyticus]|uniref:CinA-like protein n=1 Tax=Breznakibacter xylanolyticus TaxID=990 RepID=A0A2W7NPX9_9BACT|nr:competence/damage-inducible protein A [Breznakibacter xylanolyticus]PZX15316.1 nicotinamide-nucleotide amidase [Breznakibacter xylanolyticus]
MNIEIITIGDEILIGQVVDTNSAWMGTELNKVGFEVSRITSISDDREAIAGALHESLSRVPCVLMTGGLGPTRDDITKHVLCDFFNTRLVFNEQVYSDVETLLKGRVGHINELNRSQAMVPEGCTVIRNPVGTAPVMWFERDGGVVVSMPGVPSEMKHAMIHEVIGRLQQRFHTDHILHKTVHIFQIPEAVLAEMLSDWEDAIPPFIKVAYLPQPGRIRLRLTARGSDAGVMQRAINQAVDALQPIVGRYIFGYDDDSIEKRLGEMLVARGQTLATAESCTGGAIGAAITSVPGSSAYYNGGVVAYGNEVKHEVLGVSTNDLNIYGAVSEPVVSAMARGVQRLMRTHWGVATSGVAGPSGGTPEKPVGTVWIAVCNPQGQVNAQKFAFGPFRDRTVLRSVDMALMMLMNELLDDK